jgi:antitoxin ParD1/3/4
MGTMNISLSDDLESFVAEQVAERGYGTSSEYVLDLIRREQQLLTLRNRVLEGTSSPRTGKADASYFDALRARVRPSGASEARIPRKG